MRPPLGVYLHVPYCATICGYCDFNTYTRGDRSGWAETAIAELRLAGIDRPADTVFFGGGTPTLLPPEDLLGVLREIELAPGAEVTVEANPDSVDERALATLREGGATRISFGMQSGVEHVLRFLGRTHAAGRPPQAAREARAAGFEHVSLDLIYGSPAETDADWRASLGVHDDRSLMELDRRMDRAQHQMREAIEVLEVADELERVDRFVRALQADLILPEDF